jgi:hypothetical protein
LLREAPGAPVDWPSFVARTAASARFVDRGGTSRSPMRPELGRGTAASTLRVLATDSVSTSRLPVRPSLARFIDTQLNACVIKFLDKNRT